MKLNAKISSICIRFSMRSAYGHGRNCHIIEELGYFYFCKLKFPSTLLARGCGQIRAEICLLLAPIEREGVEEMGGANGRGRHGRREGEGRRGHRCRREGRIRK